MALTCAVNDCSNSSGKLEKCRAVNCLHSEESCSCEPSFRYLW